MGPDLIEDLVPGYKLLATIGKAVAEKVGWMNELDRLIQRKQAHSTLDGQASFQQSHIFEQYTNVIKALATEQPLLLIVDDLHWADSGSIALLFHLARRTRESRILIIGALRADELALGREAGRHPLDTVVNELKRYHGDIEIDLGQTTPAQARDLMDALLDATPNRLGRAFRETLYRHTEGQPLFTVELLRELQESKGLVRDADGQWIEGPSLDWKELPARVEGVFQERVGRLAENLREILDAASVEGREFTGQVLARVEGLAERDVLRALSHELERRHALVRELGEVRVNHLRLARYQFIHALCQQYLYDHLAVGVRRLLHSEVARVLEALYAGAGREIAARLAFHYAEAGEDDKAITHYFQAGDNAMQVGAGLQAVAFYQAVLERSAELPVADETIDVGRIHERLGDVYLIHLSRHDDADKHYQAFLERAQTPEARARAYRKLGNVELSRGVLPQAKVRYEKALEELSALPMTVEASYVHGRLGYLLLSQGQWDVAEEQVQAGLEISRALSDKEGLADANRLMGMIATEQGQLDAARNYQERGLELYRELGDLPRVAMLCNNLGDVYRLEGRMAEALSVLKEGLDIAGRIGGRREEAALLLTTGELFLDQGEWEAAITHLMQALPLAEESGTPERIIVANHVLGAAYASAGQTDLARHHLTRAVAFSRETGYQRYAARTFLELARLSVIENVSGDARSYFRLAEEAAGAERSSAFLGVAHRYLGEYHLTKRQWERAVQSLERSLTYLDQATLITEAAKTRLLLARVYAGRQAEGDRARICTHLRDALAVFRGIDAPTYESEVSHLMKTFECGEG